MVRQAHHEDFFACRRPNDSGGEDVSVIPTRAERMIAGRYLRTRETDGFISFIAIFSLIGVALGVATLIVVLSVMNGFRGQLYDRILGMNGHIQIAPEKGVITDWESVAQRVARVPFVMSVTPVAERQTMLTTENATRALEPYQRPEILATRSTLANFGAFGFAQPAVYEDIGWTGNR